MASISAAAAGLTARSSASRRGEEGVEDFSTVSFVTLFRREDSNLPERSRCGDLGVMERTPIERGFMPCVLCGWHCRAGGNEEFRDSEAQRRGDGVELVEAGIEIAVDPFRNGGSGDVRFPGERGTLAPLCDQDGEPSA